MLNIASTTGTMTLLLLMALVTLLTRWGGVYVMAFIPISPRVKQFIQAMSGSVLVAIIAPIAMSGDAGARLALAVTATIMLWCKKPLPAIACGVGVAALVRLL